MLSIKEPYFVLGRLRPRLQNRHPDRDGRVKTAFLEEMEELGLEFVPGTEFNKNILFSNENDVMHI